MIRLRMLPLVQAVLFAASSLVHAGVLLGGYEHSHAATAEGIIAVVLLASVVGSLVWPGSMRTLTLAAQGFALVGTLVGIFTIAIGVGPQRSADYLLHALLLALLAIAWLHPEIRPSGTPTPEQR